MPNAKQLLYQAEKTAEVFYKNTFLKNFAIFTESTCENIQEHLF